METNSGGQKMNLAAMGTVGGIPIQPPVPIASTISDRVMNLEERMQSEERCRSILDTALSCMITEIQALRNQLGMSPLSDDHYTT